MGGSSCNLRDPCAPSPLARRWSSTMGKTQIWWWVAERSRRSSAGRPPTPSCNRIAGIACAVGPLDSIPDCSSGLEGSMAPWRLLGHSVASLWPAGGSPPSLGQVPLARADGSVGPLRCHRRGRWWALVWALPADRSLRPRAAHRGTTCPSSPAEHRPRIL